MSDHEIEDGLAAAEREALPPLASKEEKIAYCAGLDQNDTGNAQRLITHFSDDILVVRELGFLQWAGTHWELTGGEERMAIFAQKTAKLIEEEVAHIKMTPKELAAIEAARGAEMTEGMSDEEKKAVESLRADAAIAQKAFQTRKNNRRKYALSSGNNGKLVGMVKQATPHITIGPDQMDADPMVFNCLNGTLIFERRKDPDEGTVLETRLVPHDRSMHIAKCAPVAFDPTAACPKWMELLERFQPDEDRRTFLQVFAGYSLTGLTDEQKLVFNYGAGANAKSTFIEAISRLMGAYAGQLNPESVTGQGHRRGDQATPDLATLGGKRLVRVSELPKGQSVKEDLIKGLTGGEPIMVRHLNKGFFDMVPIFKGWMSGNDMPYITGTDWGIWRRLLIVPWEVTISDKERRPMAEILAELDAERSGILNWLLEGLAIWVNEGLRVPESVSSLTSNYKSEMDPIQNFIDACIEFVPPPEEQEDGQAVPVAEVTGAAMYKAYETWCRASGVKIFSSTMFGRELPKKGIEKVNGRIRKYINVRLNMPEEITYEDEFPTVRSHDNDR